MAAENIDQVLEGLELVVEKSRAGGERIGYFAALYRQVTLAVKDAVVDEQFEDNDRMDRFDAEFGQRYFASLEAWQQRQAHSSYPRTWRDSFEATRRDDLAVVQHLLLGINAHINVDLAVAAARTSPGSSIHELEKDFEHVNDILISVLDRIQAVVNEFSLVMRVLDFFSGRLDEELLGFSVRKARANAWDAAVVLANVPPDLQPQTIRLLDTQARKMGRLIVASDTLVPQALLERAVAPSVSEVVERLNAPLRAAP